MKLIPIPAFSDNYLWLLHDGHNAIVVDPGDAEPVQQFLEINGLHLKTILVTHHHMDHIGGVDALREATGAQVFGPATELIPKPYKAMVEGDIVETLGLHFSVIDVPGHTAGHIAYFAKEVDGTPLLFCGDTLFSGGCGRLFEGTPSQMLSSLDRLARLPHETRVCCTHEYTLSNLAFAVTVDPNNSDLLTYYQYARDLRAQNEPTLPSTIKTELAINPFMRTRELALISAAISYDPTSDNDISHFAAIRAWKNNFKA